MNPSGLSPGALVYFLELVDDADNWSGCPLIGGNVEQTNERDGFLTALKRAGLVTTDEDRCRVNGRVQTNVWCNFTDAGRELARDNGRDIDWTRKP